METNYIDCMGCRKRPGNIVLVTKSGMLELCEMCHSQLLADTKFQGYNRKTRRSMAKKIRKGEL